jgi:hypothetical protein
VDVCLVKVSKAEVESVVGSIDMISGSNDSDEGTPLYEAISRCNARRCPSLKFNTVRSSSVMSTTVSQLWKPFSERTWWYSISPSRSRTSFSSGMLELEGERIDMTWLTYDGGAMAMGQYDYLKAEAVWQLPQEHACRAGEAERASHMDKWSDGSRKKDCGLDLRTSTGRHCTPRSSNDAKPQPAAARPDKPELHNATYLFPAFSLVYNTFAGPSSRCPR